MVRSLTLFLLICCISRAFSETDAKEDSTSILKNNLENKFFEYVDYFTKSLERFNDNRLGDSEIGKMLHYNELKPTFKEIGRPGRNLKKMSPLLPMIFHIGATSTWMVVTAIMATKSVALGLALLVFKIAVSAAKVSSFFTTLKNKQHDGWSHHHDIGHDRSFALDHHIIPDHHTIPEHDTSPEHHIIPEHHHSHHEDHSSYHPEWSPSTYHYKTIPTSYKTDDIPAEDREFEYEESKNIRGINVSTIVSAA